MLTKCSRSDRTGPMSFGSLSARKTAKNRVISPSAISSKTISASLSPCWYALASSWFSIIAATRGTAFFPPPGTKERSATSLLLTLPELGSATVCSFPASRRLPSTVPLCSVAFFGSTARAPRKSTMRRKQLSAAMSQGEMGRIFIKWRGIPAFTSLHPSFLQEPCPLQEVCLLLLSSLLPHLPQRRLRRALLHPQLLHPQRPPAPLPLLPHAEE